MIDISSAPGASGEAAARFRGQPTLRKAPVAGAPVAESAAPATAPVSLTELETRFADLVGKGVVKHAEELEELKAKINRLKSGEEQQAGRESEDDIPAWLKELSTPTEPPAAKDEPVAPASTPAKNLAGLEAKLNTLKGKAGGRKERERLKAEIRKLKSEGEKKPDDQKGISDQTTPAGGERATTPAVEAEIPPAEKAVEPEAAESAPYDSAIEPSPYITRPEDITAGNLDGGVIDKFSHNAALVLGGDGVTGLIRGKLDELTAQQERYQRGKAKIAGMKEEHGRRLFGLAESKAVADTRAEANAAKTAKSSENIVRDKFLEAVGLDPVEDKALLDKFRLWDRVQSEIVQATTKAGGTLTADAETELFSRFNDPNNPELMINGTSLDHVDNLRELQRNLALKTEENKQYSYFHFTEHGWYINEKGARIEGVRVPVHGKKESFRFQGRQVLEARNAEAQRKLTDAQHREEAVRKAQEGIRKTLPAREKALVESGERLTRIGQFVQERFVPDREELLATITELGDAREALGDLSRMQELGRKHEETITRKTALRLADLPGEIDDLVGDISEMTDPRERLAECTDLARGLQLADQENPDVSRLSRDDQFQLVLAQTLLGIPAAPEPTPPPAGQPPEEPPEAPALTETRTVSQMKAEELNTLGIEGLRAISAKLTPDQVASLSLDTRSSLEQEGLLTANQYGKLPEVIDIANLANQLELVPDNQVAGELKKMVEAARQKGEEALGDVKLLLEELRARVAAVISSDSPADADQPMMHDGAKAALEKNLTSPDKTVAARAKTALKLLGAAGLMALMASNTGGEQH